MSLEIHTENPQMKNVLRLAKRYAENDESVFITGETGTGKDVIARFIHQNSFRCKKPFIVMNSSAVPRDLLESELFGHKRGAFTGAVTDKLGLLETADGGTFFLDEVAEMPLPLQVKLLRTLESGEIMPVGSNRVRRVDVRFIAATCRGIDYLLDGRNFRRDLFYRLYILPLHLIPLRERKEDILKLARDFATERNRTVGPDAEMILLEHKWDGNVRELKNTISRAMSLVPEGNVIGADNLIFAPSTKGRLHVPLPTMFVRESLPQMEHKTLEEYERDLILARLRMCGWNKKAAAASLKIAKSTLHIKIKKYGLREC